MIAYVIFGATLLAVALNHKQRTLFALVGLGSMTIFQVLFGDFGGHEGVSGLAHHLKHEWALIITLMALLTGFEVVAHHFKSSNVPSLLPARLPDGVWGAFSLLMAIFVFSAFLDNIAAAILGASVASKVFVRRDSHGHYHPHLHTGYLVAIVAAANAGGAGSVVGDTTTTMIWLKGHSPLAVLPAFLPALVAVMFFGAIAANQQNKLQPILKDPIGNLPRVDWVSLVVVVGILSLAITTNVVVNLSWRQYAGSFPWIGAAVWVGIFLSSPWRKPHWHDVYKAGRGAVFLVSLVLGASMVPVAGLPQPGWSSTLGLGFVSSIFDNIPLTSLALKQGGYDWALLAFAVGFGGSMIPFGSSAGVSVSNDFPQAAGVKAWVKNGWHVPVAYVLAFAVYMLFRGWNP